MCECIVLGVAGGIAATTQPPYALQPRRPCRAAAAQHPRSDDAATSVRRVGEVMGWWHAIRLLSAMCKYKVLGFAAGSAATTQPPYSLQPRRACRAAAAQRRCSYGRASRGCGEGLAACRSIALLHVRTYCVRGCWGQRSYDAATIFAATAPRLSRSRGAAPAQRRRSYERASRG